MAFGFSATSETNDRFLITDNFENLHFLGQATAVLPVPDSDIEGGSFRTGSLAPACNPDDFANGTRTPAITRYAQTNVLIDPDSSSDRSRFNAGVIIDLGCAAGIESITFRRGASTTPASDYRRDTNGTAVFNLDPNINVTTRFGDAISDFTITLEPSFTRGGPNGNDGSITGGVLDGTTSISNIAFNSWYANGTITVNIGTTGTHQFWAFSSALLGGPAMTIETLNLRAADPVNNPPAINPRVVHTHTFTSAETPLVFIKPADTDRFYALITQDNVGNAWTFKTVVSGDNDVSPPELYCFVPPKGITAPTETHGMLVQKANGDATFDSRLRPLAIVDGGISTPPVLPGNSGTPLDVAYSDGGSLDGGGTHITDQVSNGNTVINVFDTSTLPSAGTGIFHCYTLDSSRGLQILESRGNTPNRIPITWTSKTATSITLDSAISGIPNVAPIDVNAAFGTNYPDPITQVHNRAYVTATRAFESPASDYSSHDASTLQAHTLSVGGIARSNLMFAAPSLAQAVYSGLQISLDRQPEVDVNGSGGRIDAYNTYLRWVLYRSAFRIGAVNFDAGWNPWLSGLLSSVQVQDSTWRGQGSTDEALVGLQPYVDQTINRTSNAYLIADASKYQ